MYRSFSTITILVFIIIYSGCESDFSSLSPERADKYIFDNIGQQLQDSSKVTEFYTSLQIHPNISQLNNSPSYNLLKGSYLYHHSKIDSAEIVLKSIMENSTDKFSHEFMARWYNRMANIYREKADRDSTIYSYKKAAAYFNKTEYDFDRALVLNSIGFMFWEVSRFDSALSYFYQSLLLKENYDDIDSYGTTLNNIGTVYYQYALYDKALEYFVRSIEIQKEVNDNDGAALILTNIGLVYNETNQLDKALQYFGESLEYAKVEMIPTTFGYIYFNIGSTYLKINLDSAEVYFNKAMEKYSIGNSVGGILISFKGLGETYFLKKQYGIARVYFEKMLEYAEANDNLIRAAEAKYHLGLIALKETKYSLAEYFLLESVELSENINKLTLLRDNYKSLGEIYEATGRANDALSAFREYLNFQENIKDKDMEQRLSRLKEEFDTQTIRSELALRKFENDRQKFFLYGFAIIIAFLLSFTFMLYRTNKRKKIINTELETQTKVIEIHRDELQRINQELKNSNDSKEKLFSIIAHDLKNPFFTLMGYISLLKDDQIDDADRKHCIEDLDRTTKNTYSLLENLLHLSQSRTQKIEFSPSIVDMRLLLLNIKLNVASQIKNKSLSLNFDIQHDHIYADQSLLEIIIRNLINNAIKFSNPGGMITVGFFNENGKHIIIVEDDGIGMDEETRNNLFNIDFIRSTPGTAGEKGTGLGLSLCKEFVDKHNGILKVISETSKGSKFIVELPMN